MIFDYYFMEILKIDKRQWITLLLVIASLFYFMQASFALDCSEAQQQCNVQKAWWAERIALQTQNGWSVESDPTDCSLHTIDGEPPDSRQRATGYPFIWCSMGPLRCSLPEIKVGTKPNGDDECACPPQYPNSQRGLNDADIKEKHLVGISDTHEAPPPPAPGVMDSTPAPRACLAEANDSCAEGYKKNPDYVAAQAAGTDGSEFINPSTQGYCVLDAPACPEGTFETQQNDGDPLIHSDCSSGRCCGTCQRGYTANVNGSCDMTCPDGSFWEHALDIFIGVGPQFSDYPAECRGMNGVDQPPDCENGQTIGYFYADTGNPFGKMECYCPSGMLVGGNKKMVNGASIPQDGTNPLSYGTTTQNYQNYDQIRIPARTVKEFKCLNVIDPETGKPVIPDNMPPEFKQAADDGMMADPQVVGEEGKGGEGQTSPPASGKSCMPILVGGITIDTCMADSPDRQHCFNDSSGQQHCITLPSTSFPCDRTLPLEDPNSCGYGNNPDPLPPESLPDYMAHPSQESPSDNYPETPDYYACNSVGSSIGGVSISGELICTRTSDGKTSQQYCADQIDSTTGETKTVCYSGKAIEQRANTACSGNGTAYLVGGRWQCANSPPPLDNYSNPEQGCPPGTIQTSICNDWQCLPPNYRLPTNLDCKQPISTSSTGGTGGTGTNSNGSTGSNSGTSTTTTTTTTTSVDGKSTTITNTTNIDTKGLQQDSTGKQTNQILSGISAKQNAIADNTAKSAASNSQTASNTAKIAGDTSKMATSLSNIDGKLGGTGRGFSNSTMPDSGDGKLYKTAYPDGFGGVWTKRKAEIMATPIMKSLLPSIDFLPSGGTCPAFIFPKMAVGETTYFEDISFPPESLCWIWTVFKTIIIISAILYARKIIMGV